MVFRGFLQWEKHGKLLDQVMFFAECEKGYVLDLSTFSMVPPQKVYFLKSNNSKCFAFSCGVEISPTRVKSNLVRILP